MVDDSRRINIQRNTGKVGIGMITPDYSAEVAVADGTTASLGYTSEVMVSVYVRLHSQMLHRGFFFNCIKESVAFF